MQIIILAGGFGTRLQSVVRDVPKPMADINGKPFLDYIFQYLSQYNISKIILSIGYKQEIVENYFKTFYKDINIEYSREEKPLGTGGAIKKALAKTQEKNILVLNGDTFFQIDIDSLFEEHTSRQAQITLSLKKMYNFDRYGSVVIENQKVKRFEEKKHCESGYINTGIYIIQRDIFDNFSIPEEFAFEEFLSSNIYNLKVYGKAFDDAYFIDIGVPQDYEKAIIDFKELF